MSPIPPLPEADELSRAVLDDIALRRWSAVTERFDAVMREKLTADELAGNWVQVEEMVGAYQGHGEPAAAKRPTDDLTYTDTTMNFEAGDLVARITFRDDQTIAGLFFLNPAVVAAMESGPTRVATE